MKQRIICKTLAVAVILLFLGLAIKPAFAIEVSVSKTSDSEEDCDLCPSVEDVVDSKDVEKYQEISKRFSIVKEIYMDAILYWDFPIICPLLFILQNSLIAIEFYSWYFGFHFDLPLVYVMIEILDVFGLALHCSWYVYPP